MFIEDRLKQLEKINLELKNRINELEKIIIQDTKKIKSKQIYFEDETTISKKIRGLYFPVGERYKKRVIQNLENNLPLRAGIPWSNLEEETLVNGFKNGMSIKELTERHNRKSGGIKSRLKKLGIID